MTGWRRTATHLSGRSREGAWIEMLSDLIAAHPKGSRSREGAWIEIVWQIQGH